MERTVMKEGVCGTNVFDFGSKSSIGARSDNFINAIEMIEADKCRHFSIRAYVGEFRRKDWKFCWPFSPLVDDEQSKKESDMLPPLHVPEFRWWGCQNCVQRSDASDDAAAIRRVSNSSSHNIRGSKNSDVNTSVDVIGSEVCPLTHEHMKEKVANVMSVIRQDLLSSENYSKIVVKEVDKTMREPISSEMKVAQIVNGEFCNGAETINLDVENSGLVEFGDTNCGSCEVDKGMVKCSNNSCTLVFRKENVVDPEEAKTSEQVEGMKCHKKPEIRNLENEVVGSHAGFHTSQLGPLDWNENDYDKDAHGYSSPILSSRKPQKFRLLSEILHGDDPGASTKISSFDEKTHFHVVNREVTRTKSADEADGLGPSTAQISVGENVEKDTAGTNKKRKAFKIEDQEHRMRCYKSVSTNVRLCKSDKENACIDSAIAHSISVNEAPEGLHSLFRSHQCNKNGSERKVIQGKRKKKTSHQSNDGSTERGIHPFLSLDMAAQVVDLNPGVFNEKATHRKDVISDLKTSVAVAEGDRSTTCHDVNCMSTKMDIVPARTSQEKASKRGLLSFLKYCMVLEETDEESALKNQKHEVHGVGNGKTSLIIHSRVMPQEDHVLSKEIGRTTQMASGTGSHLGMEIKKVTPRKDDLSIKPHNMSQVQYGASPIWSKDLSFINGCEKNTDVQAHSEAIKDQGNGRADKTNELESLNGIPVEIVELLAKNRHERRRLEAEKAKENKLCMLKKTKNATDSEKSELRGLHDNGMPRYPSGKNLKMWKPQSNAVSSISGAGRSVIVEPIEESIAYCSHLKQTCKSSGSKTEQSEESHDTKVAFAFSDSPVNLSSGNQLCKVCTSKNFSVQSCRCDGNKLGWSNSSFKCLTSCHKRRIVSSPPQIRGAHHVSSPNVADYPSGLASFQKSANLSQRPNMNIHSETVGKIHTEPPCACTHKKVGNCPNVVGQLELCSNETMHATQLLKLMGAGTSSKVQSNVDVNMDFTEQHSFPQITRPKWISPPDEGLLGDSFGDFGLGKSSGYFPAVPISDAVAFPGQRDKNCVGRSQILGRKMVNDRLTATGMRKRKGSDCLTAVQDADCELHRFGDGSGSWRKKQESFPIDSLKAEFHPHLRSVLVASDSHLIESSIDNVEVEKKLGTVGLVKGSCGMVEELHSCSLNRNPADFSIPEARNEFTTRGGDLKFKKTVSKRGRPRLRMMKLQAIKESAQH